MKGKKLTAIILTALMIFGMLPVMSSAAEIVDSGSCGENLTYTLDSDGVLTISGTGEVPYWENAPWCDYCDSVKSVVVSEGVTSIGDYAFRECAELTSVTISDGVTSIGSMAFFKCTGLRNINIPHGVTSIGDYAFAACTELTGITIPDSVTSIGASAFNGCIKLTGITIPGSVTSISDAMFYECMKLADITIPDSVTSIGEYAFSRCPELRSITIPDSVTSIGDSAFMYCSGLECATLGKGLTEIGNEMFMYCTALSEITIPDSVTSIGGCAFVYCVNLKSIVLPRNLKTVNDICFMCSGLESIVFPEGTERIGDLVFEECPGLKSVTIPSTVTHIGTDAFDCCMLLAEITNKTDSLTVLTGNEEYVVFSDSNAAEMYLDAFAAQLASQFINIPQDITDSQIDGYRYSLFVPVLNKYAALTGETVSTADEDIAASVDMLLAWLEGCVTDYLPLTVHCLKDSAQHSQCIEMGVPHFLLDSVCDCRCGIHHLEANDYEAPDCTHNGYRGGEGCLECGLITVEPEIIPPTGHSDEDGDGYCDACGIEYTEPRPDDDGTQTSDILAPIRRMIAAIRSVFDTIIALFRAIFG